MSCKFFSSVNSHYGRSERFIYGEANSPCVANNMHVCGVRIVKKKKEKKILIGCKYIGVSGSDNKHTLFDKGKK